MKKKIILSTAFIISLLPMLLNQYGIAKGSFVFGYWDGSSEEAPSYIRKFEGKSDLKNGDAVIMNGPLTEGAVGWEDWTLE